MDWPGRLEVVDGSGINPGWTGDLVLDGAHNPHALAAVVPELAARYPDGVVVVFAAMRDKVIPDMLELLPPTWPVVVSRAEGDRSADPAAVAALLPGHSVLGVTAEVSEALDIASAAAAPHRPVVALGSLRLVGAIRDHLGLTPR
ncbi:glutamate ligase domain-containing protein [Kitasatospora sp. NPDC058218]|uniref:glutamate ligase domain-containing protein n=1 Tax=Kitasatospora sp. NPDC058218 TaxID=3346385 RepID=UPI0036DB9072